MRIFITFFTLIIITSCKNHSKLEVITTKNAHPTLNGVWNSVGYGRQLNVNDSIATIYDINSNGCALNMQVPKAFLDSYFSVEQLTRDSLTLRLGFTDYGFSRTNSKICNESSIDNDPLSNFDALWHTFNENYPSFELRGVDWKKSKAKFRSKLNPESTGLELFNVLNEMISELKDGHVSLELPESLEDQFQDDNNDEDDTDELRILAINNLNKIYLKKLKNYNKGTINWGVTANNFGYIQINSFHEIANYDIDKNLDFEDYWGNYWEQADDSDNYTKEALEGFNNVLPTIFNDLKDTQTFIIDLRFNGGGFDLAGLDILSYFTKNKTIAFSKKARFNDRYTKSQNIYIEPKAPFYNKNVYILTSHQTASASETFVLATKNFENIKTIGSNTEGILSDILPKRLPNGWEYGLSNEIYESTNGINYEKNGIPADFEIPYNKAPEVFYKNLSLEKEDNAIEKVFQIEQSE